MTQSECVSVGAANSIEPTYASAITNSMSSQELTTMLFAAVSVFILLTLTTCSKSIMFNQSHWRQTGLSKGELDGGSPKHEASSLNEESQETWWQASEELFVDFSSLLVNYYTSDLGLINTFELNKEQLFDARLKWYSTLGRVAQNPDSSCLQLFILNSTCFIS